MIDFCMYTFQYERINAKIFTKDIKRYSIANK